MIEAAAETAITMQRTAVSVLTVVAFVVASWALFDVFVSTLQTARRIESGQSARRRIEAEWHAERARIGTLSVGVSEQLELLQAADARFLDDHTAAGLEWPDYRQAHSMVEPVAESLVRDLSESTRTDLSIAGLGLFLGLVAGVWGTWIP